ncbi:calcium-binding protein [Polynucleobacter sp. MWH-HuK1]|uniref:calcium-binding protein n=1 Tax=Polynucleobacter sp. MWH-HuK1 TaxID=1743158 RepID=UPI001C0E1152|nr:calcium-binding protein [Polynucleobacter sp. MWH-HuK1]MBU3564424.1 calcium-binding protein [Polynucleobacter sp. MWH-HuK1]
MAQINVLIDAARAVVQSTSSAVGVSAANANLVAVAGALSGMQMSGYDVVDPRMFDALPAPSETVGAVADIASETSHYIPSQFAYQGVEQNIFSGLVNPDATFDFQNFFVDAPIQARPLSANFQFNDFALESDSLFDPSHPDGAGIGPGDESGSESDSADKSQRGSTGAEDAEKADAEVLASESMLGDGAAQFNAGFQGLKGGIAQASSTAANSINYASSASSPYAYSSFYNSFDGSSSAIQDDLLIEPSGFIYLSSGSGDVVEGTRYADTLFGSLSGGDTLIGGAGSDTYAIYSNSTLLIEDAAGGSSDTAYIGVENYLGTAGIENIAAIDTEAYATQASTAGPYLTGLDTGWRINGSADAQTLSGLYGADILNGGGGNDLLIGGAGDDVYIYTGSEIIIENTSQGHDIVQASVDYTLSSNIEVAIANENASDVNLVGNSLDNLLVGNDAVNNLSGGAGSDTLVSGSGGDILTGGLGSDTFILNSQDSFLGEITDFESGQDHISLLNTDPSVTLSMAPSDGFTGVAGQLWSVDGGLQIDWDGDAQFDALLLINEAPTLADLTLVDHNHIPYF